MVADGAESGVRAVAVEMWSGTSHTIKAWVYLAKVAEGTVGGMRHGGGVRVGSGQRVGVECGISGLMVEPLGVRGGSVEEDLVSRRVNSEETVRVMNVINVMGKPAKLGELAVVEAMMFIEGMVDSFSMGGVDEGVVMGEAKL